MNGERHSDADPRREVDIKIHNSCGAQTNANIWNATRGLSGPAAVRMWNDVGSPYFFDPRQDIEDKDAEILIGMKDLWNFRKDGCAMTFVPDAGDSSANRTIYLPPGAANWSQQDLACIIAHEIGHAVGLAHAPIPCQSIMRVPHVEKEADCKCASTIQQGDVEKANQFAENALANCGKDSKTNNFGTPVGGYVDPEPYRYNPTCYYYFEEIPLYQCALVSVQDGSCHPDTPPEYIGSIYVLVDVFCY